MLYRFYFNITRVGVVFVCHFHFDETMSCRVDIVRRSMPSSNYGNFAIR